MSVWGGHGDHPVLRGTFATIAKRRHILYTRGSVDLYRVYPGMYIPTPLGIRPAMVEHSIETLAEEILALSKMNWNQSQLDGRPRQLPRRATRSNRKQHECSQT